jgi:hypothetical protein
VIEVEQGDHSLRVPKRTGKTDSEVLGEVVEGVCRWIEAVSA